MRYRYVLQTSDPTGLIDLCFSLASDFGYGKRRIGLCGTFENRYSYNQYNTVQVPLHNSSNMLLLRAEFYNELMAYKATRTSSNKY
jgi:hypothetical protein